MENDDLAVIFKLSFSIICQAKFIFWLWLGGVSGHISLAESFLFLKQK